MTNLAFLGAVAVTITLIVAVTVLTWHGSITGEACISIFSGVLGGAIVGGAQHVGAQQGARAALASKQGDV